MLSRDDIQTQEAIRRGQIGARRYKDLIESVPQTQQQTPMQNPFAHLIPNQQPVQAQPASQLSAENPFAHLIPSKASSIKDIVKQSHPEFVTGSPQNRSMLEEMITSAVGAPGISVLGRALGKLGSGAVSAVKNATKPLSSLEQKLTEATGAHETAAQGLQQAKATSENLLGASNPEKLQNRLTSSEEKLRNMIAPEDRVMHVPNVQNSLENVENTAVQHEAAQQNLESAENKIKEHLHEGSAHDVHAASRILETQEAERKAASQEFENIKSDLEHKNIELSNPEASKENIDTITKQLLELEKESKGNAPEAKELFKQLDKLGKKDVIPANEYWSALKSVRQYAREAREKAYEPGMNEEERMHWKNRYNSLEDQADKMGKSLEEGVGSEHTNAIANANKRWRENVIPLQRNTTYQNIRYKGRMPSDIINTLRGTDPGDVIMRNIIKNDPEISRYVVGQKFADSPEKLHKAGELSQEYIQKMPELQQYMAEHKNAMEAVPQAKQAAEFAKKTHESVIKSQLQADKVSTENRLAQEKFENEHAALSKEIEDLNKQIPALREASEHKGMSLQEKIKAKAELKKATLKKKAATGKLWKIGTAIGGGIGIPYGIVKSIKNLSDGEQ